MKPFVFAQFQQRLKVFVKKAMSITLQIMHDVINGLRLVLFIQPLLKAIPVNALIIKFFSTMLSITAKGVARTVGYGFAMRRPRVQIN
jgi:hypothetical protein